jgi:hypothetical protein
MMGRVHDSAGQHQAGSRGCNPDARALALTYGADMAVEPGDAALPVQAADAVLDFVGAGATLASGAKMVRPRGHVGAVGRGAGSFAFTHSALPHGALLSTNFGGSQAELMAEGMGRYYRHRHGVDFRAIRFPSVVGPGNHAPGLGTYTTEMIESAMRGAPYVVQVTPQSAIPLLHVAIAPGR